MPPEIKHNTWSQIYPLLRSVETHASIQLHAFNQTVLILTSPIGKMFVPIRHEMLHHHYPAKPGSFFMSYGTLKSILGTESELPYPLK